MELERRLIIVDELIKIIVLWEYRSAKYIIVLSEFENCFEGLKCSEFLLGRTI
jgi:hypothetical protein